MSRPARQIATVAVLAAFVTVSPCEHVAQSDPVPRVSSSLSTNVLGPLPVGSNIEYERAISDATSGRHYPAASRLRRWYVGAHLEAGRTDIESYYSEVLGYGVTFGHRWIKPSGFSTVLGGLLGTFGSDDTWKDGSGSAGSERYFVGMLNFSLGRSS